MKKFKVKLNVEYEVEAMNEEDVYTQLEKDLGTSNRTVNTEFWSNLNIQEIERNTLA